MFELKSVKWYPEDHMLQPYVQARKQSHLNLDIYDDSTVSRLTGLPYLHICTWKWDHAAKNRD